MNRKIKLTPVQVPWKISASDEVVKFQCEDDRLELFFIADLFESCKLDKLGRGLVFFDDVSIVQLRLCFETVVHFGYSRPSQTAFDLELQKYDGMVTPSVYETFFQKWADTGICPDPQMYQVENCEIKEALNINSERLTHWLLISHDEILNIVSEKFTWEVLDYIQ